MKKRLTKLTVTLVVALSVSLLSLTAFAYTVNNLAFLYTSGGDITNGGTLKTGVTELTSNPFTLDSYAVMYLGYEAGNTDIFADNGGTIFTNNSTTAGTLGTVNTATGYFSDTTDNVPPSAMFTDTANLRIFGITPAFFSGVASSFVLPDTNDTTYLYYVVGFGDGQGALDYDDLVIAVRGETPNTVPIPAAIWLLGSGLLGLIGVRRRKKL